MLKKCPYCAEEIQTEAIKCKHCGEFLDDKLRPTPKGPWYTRANFIILCLLSVGPLGLPLVWIHPRLMLWHKVVISVAVCLATLWLWHTMSLLISQMKQTVSTLGITL